VTDRSVIRRWLPPARTVLSLQCIVPRGIEIAALRVAAQHE
jgi:hypothetical protein